MIHPTGTRLALLGVLLLALAACNEKPAPPGTLPAVASFYPLYEFTRRVAGTAGRVETLVPPGVEPHDWEPSPQDVTRLRQARLFVFNGAGLEPWVERLMPEITASGAVVVRASDGIPLLRVAPAGHDPAPIDPHVWLDPVLAQSMVENIRTGLAKADPAHAGLFATNATALTAALRELHEAFELGLRQCERREVVTSHAAFTYLASRYHLTMVPISGLTPGSEPAPARLASLVRFAREKKVKYIFFEPLVSPRLAETLAREVGAQTLVFNPIEGAGSDDAQKDAGYVALMQENLKTLRLALHCS